MAAGEVLLNGPQLGITGGTLGFELNKLLDASVLTFWSTFPAATYGWAGMDAGVPATLSRVLLTAQPPNSDCVIGATIEASASPVFNDGTLVQGNVNHDQTGGTITSLAAAFTSAQTAGNTNIVLISEIAAAVISTVTDTAGNSYTKIASSASNLLTVWIASNIVAASAGANTVTIAWSTGSTFPTMQIMEFNGIVTANPLDGSSSSSGTGTAISSGNITVANANALVVAFAVSGGSPTFSPGAGYALAFNMSPWAAVSETGDVRNAGTYTATFTQNISQAWTCIAVGLKLSVPAPTTLATISTRPDPGVLLNQYTIGGAGGSFRYFRYNSKLGPVNNYGSVSDLDFIVNYVPGVIGAAVAPTILPTGRVFDLPIVVSMASTTTDAHIFYTLNGSTPSASSFTYTGPFVISATCILTAIAISPGVSNSRVTTAYFTIGSSFSTLYPQTDDRNYILLSETPDIFLDPVSGYWYLYGVSQDGPGVQWYGAIYCIVYRSADLRNWKFITTFGSPPGVLVGGYNNFKARMFMMYSAANGYVMWMQTGSDNLTVFKSSSPEGPFTQFAAYTGFNGVTSTGDGCYFMDTDGISAYGCYTAGANAAFFKMNSTWDNWDGVNFNQVSAAGTFGIGAPFVNDQLDGPHMFKSGSTYFFLCNSQNGWAPTLNAYATATSPLGPWTNKGNPYVQQPSGSPNYALAYDSQNCYVIQIPGRSGSFILTGDRWDTGLVNTVATSQTANFQAWRNVILPISVVGSTMSVNWYPSWSLDALFPTTSGAPAAPTAFSMSLVAFSWVNNETNPNVLYLDFATDTGFTQNTASEFIGIGTSSTLPTSYNRVYRAAPSGFYRLRSVNANGSTVTSNLLFFSPSASATFATGASQFPLIETASYIITTSAGVSAGTATFQEICPDGIARSLVNPAPITLAASQTYNGTISGLFHGLILSITGLTGGTITYSEIKTMTNRGTNQGATLRRSF